MGKIELNLTIEKDGTLTCEVKGAKGKACLKYMEMIEQIIGKAIKKNFTSEYYEQETLLTDKIKTKSSS